MPSYPQPQSGIPAVCPNCGMSARFISEYQQWYCDTCQTYLPIQQAQPTQPTRKPFDTKRTKKLIAGIGILVVILVILFYPFTWQVVSKYEVVNVEFDSPSRTCGITIRDLGVGGEYFVEFTGDGIIDYDFWYIEQYGVRDFLGYFRMWVDDCSYTINAPKVIEHKSIFQILTGL